MVIGSLDPSGYLASGLLRPRTPASQIIYQLRLLGDHICYGSACHGRIAVTAVTAVPSPRSFQQV